MAFHDVQFPAVIGRGAQVGPQRRTQVITLGSGREERNASWLHSRRVFDVSYGIRQADDLAAVTAFFEARNARLHAFRFKDWSDFKSCAPSQAPAADDQQIGVGDGVRQEFQLVKSYSDAAASYARRITRPVDGTVLVSVDGTPLSGGDFTVDHSTGIVTIPSAPGVDEVVRAGFEFDVPVRFDQDEIITTLEVERLGRVDSIRLIEVRE